MTKLIGDRKEKSVLEEMEEVARERNADVAEEERMEALKKAKEEELRKKEEAERAKAPSEPIQSSSSDIIMADYHGLEWDLNVPRIGYSGIKNTYTYDESLERLKKEGKRHPLPSEALTLLADHLEGKLQGDLKAVAVDMLSDCGEWLSMAVERTKDKLICYLHPDGLIWNNNEEIYGQTGFQYESKTEFNVALMPSTRWIPIDQFNDNFVRLFYGRNIKDLPEKMRGQGSKARVYFPPGDEYIWPVYRCNTDPFSIICYKKDKGASRGVRPGDSFKAHMNKLIEELSWGRIKNE